MTEFSLRVVMPKEAPFDPARLMQVVENTLNEAAVAVRMEFNRTTLTWNERPDFEIDSYPGRRIVYTSNEIYAYVSGGTRPHIIRPVRARRLHFFRTGFRAKSRPNSLAANKGRISDKDETFTTVVHHPGTQARNFDRTIAIRWRKYLPQQMQRAIDNEYR